MKNELYENKKQMEDRDYMTRKFCRCSMLLLQSFALGLDITYIYFFQCINKMWWANLVLSMYKDRNIEAPSNKWSYFDFSSCVVMQPFIYNIDANMPTPDKDSNDHKLNNHDNFIEKNKSVLILSTEEPTVVVQSSR